MPTPEDFSLCEGGRFHEMLQRVGLARGARGRSGFLLVLLAIGLLPLVVLSTVAGTTLGGVDHPLVRDLGPWVRYLVVVPLFVLTEPFADFLLGATVGFFRQAGIVREPDLPAFEVAVSGAMGQATSDTAEVILFLIAMSLPHLAVASAPHFATGVAWYGTVVQGELQMSAAGRWYAWVSLPLTEFLLLRWLWRILAWWRLLWRVSRLDLAVTPAHPDRAAGLGFLMLSPRAFLPVFVGVSVIAATGVSKQLDVGGASLAEAGAPILALVLCECLMLLAPQGFFLSTLLKARNRALVGYSLTAITMMREFDGQWTQPAAPRGAELLGRSDASAMIDYASTVSLVQAMRPIGISLRQLLTLLLPLAAPFAPLLLYQYSVKQIFQQVLALVR